MACSNVLNKIILIIPELLRYAVVGGIAFALDFGTLVLLTELCKVYYLTAAAVGFLLGLIVNYILSIKWVFKESQTFSFKKEFLIFSIIGVSGLCLNELLMWATTSFAGWHYIASKVFATGFVFLYNFFLRKYILFSN